ncbi:L-2-amino-thiazoline-4-carboxylic acid hydrolase [Clostridium sp. CX1]|uniref:L-2-amino-thiazoline-4-carboxylic acid hydrolase n=1 Tax=Clostridium tanneri TaxID=3037988 RepID=A0ABU4JX05_9CLOT|nr:MULTISPECIES: L-2-amino-thiazoline-4-carboxylic acid hydrolase [unclassified Clostridium]MCT8978513.1 L-2-amino-thiazoline-4-carboxylic acid hydrolase [Clostridium sp. CX1]MDW8802668.1 L-2-amino-thiazoline-4-carboxylic acid hydrolase [Clostridium sp. A1-XYC3]
MSKIRSTDNPVERMAKLMAELYYFMAEEMIDRLGKEKGEEAIRASVTKFGKARLESMYEEAREKGLPINLDTYLKVRDMPGISWERDPENPDDITYCPMHDMWKELGAENIGSIYCEIDDVLYEGFNAEFERPLCKTCGDDCCRFLVKPKK